MIRKLNFWLKVKKFQKWETVKYGDILKFKFWSQKVEETGLIYKSTLNSFPVGRNWTGIVILKPIGLPETEFFIGYYSPKENITEISKSRRKVMDGKFSMRITKDPCFFFIASNEGDVDLVSFGQEKEIKKGIPLY